MKTIVTCQECNHNEYNYVCDTCGDNLVIKFYGVPITVSFGYGHPQDTEEVHFCNEKCLFPYIVEELKKQNPRQIITGA